jgi:two-component system, NtrC family, nitrogen regulation response regulator NtrX
MTCEILVVDDEADICAQMAAILSDEGYEIRTAQESDGALSLLKERTPSLVILDIWLQKSTLDGIELLGVIKRDFGDLPVMMMSGHGTIETAVTTLKKGAADFLEKPFKTERLLLTIERILEAEKLRRENTHLKEKGLFDFSIMGQSPATQNLRLAIDKVAPTNSRVLITGGSGSGKETVARTIHQKSKRAGSPFVVANCALMTPDRLEMELFGTEIGYNGTQPRRVGLFEQAHRGTLLLDEVTDMPLETQGKIVRALQEQKFSRVGSTQSVQVDVRVLATSSKNLAAEITNGRLREDLYYRINVVPVSVPSLKERKEDIPKLAQFFMQRATTTMGVTPRILSQEALVAMQSYAWPGNIRQLRNMVEWLLIMCPETPGRLITADMLPNDLQQGSTTSLGTDKQGELISLPLREARELFEREYLTAQINRFAGNISKTASFVGMERSALHRKLKGLGLMQHERDEVVNLREIA